MATKSTTKSRVTKKQVIAHRTRAVKDTSPNWEGCESWGADQFHKYFRQSMDYYRLESEVKSFKPFIIKWMESVGAAKDDIAAIKRLKDNRISTTMGAIASSLLRGMTPQRDDFNNGKNTVEWLSNAIVDAIKAGKDDVDPDEAKAIEDAKPAGYVPSIQERVKEAAFRMTEEIENALEAWEKDAENFDPKAFKVISLLRAVDAKAAHARIIREFYGRMLAELEELAGGDADEQLKEGYSHRSRKQIKSLIAFLQEVDSACTMLAQEAKVNRKPKAKKAVPAEKIVAKLKYKKSDEALKLVSINPADILHAKELWVYNAKSRKIGRYVASEFSELSVKGTTITGYDEAKSVMKTVRKPEEKLKEFKAAGKVQLRKFLDDINATEARMNGRINEEIILLKVA